MYIFVIATLTYIHFVWQAAPKWCGINMVNFAVNVLVVIFRFRYFDFCSYYYDYVRLRENSQSCYALFYHVLPHFLRLLINLS